MVHRIRFKQDYQNEMRILLSFRQPAGHVYLYWFDPSSVNRFADVRFSRPFLTSTLFYNRRRVASNAGARVRDES